MEVIMKKFLLLLFVFSAALLWASEPIMRVGIFTDTHVTKKVTSCKLLKNSLQFFKKNNVDMIVNVGDVSNVYEEAAYKNYRDTVKAVYGESAPREVFVFANHDRMKREKESVWEVFKDVKKHLECKNDFYDVIKLKGYTFLVIPQFMDSVKYDAMLSQAVKENPGKPIFVLDHVPAFDTVYHSKTWGEGKRRRILNKYPQAIQISGHVHGTLTNELNIWQGEFTAVNAGSLNYWTGDLVGSEPKVFYSDMVLILEVYPEKLVFRRCFSTTGEEYGADTPWSIPMPFDPKTAPYTIARRAASSAAPVFASDVVKSKVGKRDVTVTFPAAKDAFFYKLELFRQVDGAWKRFARKDMLSEFMLPVAKRKAAVSMQFDIGYFDAGKEYQVKVTPVNFFGKVGESVSGKISVAQRVADTVVYESREPMKDCKFMSELAGGKPFKLGKDGFYIHNNFNGRLEFPANVWDGKRGTKFRFTIEMHTIQPSNRCWTLCLRNPKPLQNANLRIATEGGDAGVQRYVITFNKPKDFFNYYFLIREGGHGKIRFDYVKIEKIK